MKDLSSNIKPVLAIAPGTYLNGTNPVPVVVDRQGFESVSLVVSSATVTDAQALVVEHSEDNVTYEAVTQNDCNGSLADFLAVAAAEDSTTRKLGYVGGKRYLKVSSAAAGATGAVYGVTAILGHPANAPVA
jgi:hypothetical protein